MSIPRHLWDPLHVRLLRHFLGLFRRAELPTQQSQQGVVVLTKKTFHMLLMLLTW